MNRERGLSGYREQRETATTGEPGPAVYNLFANSYPTLDCIKPPGPTVPPRAVLRTVYQLVVMPLTAIELSCF